MVPLVLICVYILYAFFRFSIVVTDVYSNAPKDWVFFPWRSKWKADTTPLIKPKVHLLASGILLVAYLSAGGKLGWIEYVRVE